jgi:pseudaminic acid synthase
MKTMRIGQRFIGENQPCFIIAEISANHNNDFEKAKRLVRIALECGADAVKLQTYTADTMTLQCSNKYFCIMDGPWKGQTLYELYKKAAMPWEWQKDLKKLADEIGILFFSTPFDATAVDFLESMDVPAYKIASFEIVDIPLIRYVALKGKPIILSTGMSSLSDIELAMKTIKENGNPEVILLKCTSDYPAALSDMNIATISALRRTFEVPVGLSDHSLGNEASIAAICLNASVIEKHIIEKRSDGGPDAHFSLEPSDMKQLVQSIRNVEAALGHTQFGPVGGEKQNKLFRKSLFVSRDITKGELFSHENIRAIRPGYGLHPKHLDSIIGKTSSCSISLGTPLSWAHVREDGK